MIQMRDDMRSTVRGTGLDQRLAGVVAAVRGGTGIVRRSEDASDMEVRPPWSPRVPVGEAAGAAAFVDQPVLFGSSRRCGVVSDA